MHSNIKTPPSYCVGWPKYRLHSTGAKAGLLFTGQVFPVASYSTLQLHSNKSEAHSFHSLHRSPFLMPNSPPFPEEGRRSFSNRSQMFCVLLCFTFSVSSWAVHCLLVAVLDTVTEGKTGQESPLISDANICTEDKLNVQRLIYLLYLPMCALPMPYIDIYVVFTAIRVCMDMYV